MPGAPVTNWIAIVALLSVVVLMATDADTRLGLYVWLVWSAVLCTGYLVLRRRAPAAPPRPPPGDSPGGPRRAGGRRTPPYGGRRPRNGARTRTPLS